MDTLSYKTVSTNDATVTKEWVLVDAENEVLGRLASKVALMLRGKHRPNFTPHVDGGDNVIIINADKIRITGHKWTQSVHYRYSGFPGGQVGETPKQIYAKDPGRLIKMAVRGMLPKNRLGDAIMVNLRIFSGSEHPHGAQNPKQINLDSIK